MYVIPQDTVQDFTSFAKGYLVPNETVTEKGFRV